MITEEQYAALYSRICSLETYLHGSRVAAWVRRDVRVEILSRVTVIRDDFYNLKKSEDDRQNRVRAYLARECPTCD